MAATLNFGAMYGIVYYSKMESDRRKSLEECYNNQCYNDYLKEMYTKIKRIYI